MIKQTILVVTIANILFAIQGRLRLHDALICITVHNQASTQYFNKIHIATKLLHMCEFGETPWYFPAYTAFFLVELKSATYQNIDSWLGFFIFIGVTEPLDFRKLYLPQFWCPCFTVFPLFLVRMSPSKIRCDICILCNIKAVGSAKACICISNTSSFTSLELKLSSLAFCWHRILIWLKFLQNIIFQTFLYSSIFCCDMMFTLLQSSKFSWWITLPCITINIYVVMMTATSMHIICLKW